MLDAFLFFPINKPYVRMKPACRLLLDAALCAQPSMIPWFSIVFSLQPHIVPHFHYPLSYLLCIPST